MLPKFACKSAFSSSTENIIFKWKYWSKKFSWWLLIVFFGKLGLSMHLHSANCAIRFCTVSTCPKLNSYIIYKKERKRSKYKGMDSGPQIFLLWYIDSGIGTRHVLIVGNIRDYEKIFRNVRKFTDKFVSNGWKKYSQPPTDQDLFWFWVVMKHPILIHSYHIAKFCLSFLLKLCV